MKITIYELLGLIKDGKAPEKIKYNNGKLYINGKVIKDIHKDVNDNFLSYVKYNPSRNVMARFLSY